MTLDVNYIWAAPVRLIYSMFLNMALRSRVYLSQPYRVNVYISVHLLKNSVLLVGFHTKTEPSHLKPNASFSFRLPTKLTHSSRRTHVSSLEFLFQCGFFLNWWNLYRPSRNKIGDFDAWQWFLTSFVLMGHCSCKVQSVNEITLLFSA